MIPERAQAIIDFWFKETNSEMHFKKDEKFDQKIKENFLKDYELACQNEYDDWQDNPMSCLALVILFDQFSRNMFRNDKKAFAQDQKTRLIVNDAVYSGYLEAMNVSQRFFMFRILFTPGLFSHFVTLIFMNFIILSNYFDISPNIQSI